MIQILKKGGKSFETSSFFLPKQLWFSLSLLLISGCSLIATRPVHEMSQTAASIRAAKEVGADVLAPDLYRQASEYFFKAKREYKFKNFAYAEIYAKKARRLAEDAEFEAIKNGGNRTNDSVPDPLANTPVTPPKELQESESQTLPAVPPPQGYDYPKPEGTPIEVYEERKAAEDKKNTLPTPESSAPPL
ncbi:MAG: DUF4398 domain-containing protein [Bdellovibrionia bacterium]